MPADGVLNFQPMVADINNSRDSYFCPQIFQGSAADDGQVDPGEIPQFLQMPLYFGRTKSQFGSGYNWSEGSIIVQKNKEILGLLNPGLNVFSIFEKMFHGILFQRKLDFILSLSTQDARVISLF